MRRVFNLHVRFLGFFLLVFLASFLLRELPFVGGLFRIPLLGFFFSAVVVSALLARLGERMASRRQFAREARELGEVDTPQRRGKLGRLLVVGGRAKEAVPHLQAALDADPDNVEWRYRLGVALLESGQLELAGETLRETARREERHAYGDVLLQLGRTELALGQAPAALTALQRAIQLEGETPQLVYHVGLVHKHLGQREEALASFGRVSELVKQVPNYQKGEARSYA
ncbi:MAG: tetratricopeptide (TPR) repeat protein, partial [Candidatus Paceibacteria bacterium]